MKMMTIVHAISQHEPCEGKCEVAEASRGVCEPRVRVVPGKGAAHGEEGQTSHKHCPNFVSRHYDLRRLSNIRTHQKASKCPIVEQSVIGQAPQHFLNPVKIVSTYGL